MLGEIRDMEWSTAFVISIAIASVVIVTVNPGVGGVVFLVLIVAYGLHRWLEYRRTGEW